MISTIYLLLVSFCSIAFSAGAMEEQTWCQPESYFTLDNRKIKYIKECYKPIPSDQTPSITKVHLSHTHAFCIMDSPSTGVRAYMGSRPISILTPVAHREGLVENAAIAFNKNESIICLGGKTISLLTPQGAWADTLCPNKAVTKIDTHPNDSSEIMSSGFHDVHIWDIATQQATQQLHCRSVINDAIYSPREGTMIATQENYCNGSNNVVIRDLRMSLGTIIKIFAVEYNKKRFCLSLNKGLHYNTDGTMLATADTHKITLFDIRADRMRLPNIMLQHNIMLRRNWTELFFAASNKLIGVQGKSICCLDTDTEIIAEIDIAKPSSFYNTSCNKQTKQLSVWSPKENYAHVYDFSPQKD